MINNVVVFTQTTIALIFACVLGVSGLTEGVQFHDGTMVVVPTFRMGFALGGMVFTDIDTLIPHERGHLQQEQELGAFYLPLVALPSIAWNLLSRAGALEWDTYYDRWPENDASKRGSANGIQ